MWRHSTPVSVASSDVMMVSMVAVAMWKIVVQLVDRFHGNYPEPDAQIGGHDMHQTETSDHPISVDTQLLNINNIRTNNTRTEIYLMCFNGSIQWRLTLG